MNRFKLITAGIRRHKLRTLFTVMSVMVAFAIFIVLNALDYGLGGLVTYGQAKRMNVIGLNNALPLRYVGEISTMPGVAAVSYMGGYNAYYRDMKNSINVMATSFPQYLKVFPDYTLSPSASAAMIADRHCAAAGPWLIKKYGWKVGDTIHLFKGARKSDGSSDWTYRLCGIFSSKLPDNTLPSLVTRYDFYNDNRELSAYKDMVGAIYIMADDVRSIDRISHDVDARYANSAYTTMTLPDNILVESVLKSFGDIGGIISAIAAVVFFSMLLVTGSSVADSIRCRMNEFAMLRALGFTRQQLARYVLGEASLVIGLGALIGVLLGKFICDAVAPSIQETLPFFSVRLLAIVLSLVLATLFAGVISWIPARRVMALEIADTLRRA